MIADKPNQRFAVTGSRLALPKGVRIGHVHLKVADLDRALQFYCGVLGFRLMQMFDRQTALISVDGYHHLLGLNTRDSEGGRPPSKGATGLYHFAILLPSRRALTSMLARLDEFEIKIDQLIDHGVSLSLYLRDPDENGIEICWDRPRKEWPLTADGSLQAFAHKLERAELL